MHTGSAVDVCIYSTWARIVFPAPTAEALWLKFDRPVCTCWILCGVWEKWQPSLLEALLLGMLTSLEFVFAGAVCINLSESISKKVWVSICAKLQTSCVLTQRMYMIFIIKYQFIHREAADFQKTISRCLCLFADCCCWCRLSSNQRLIHNSPAGENIKLAHRTENRPQIDFICMPNPNT